MSKVYISKRGSVSSHETPCICVLRVAYVFVGWSRSVDSVITVKTLTHALFGAVNTEEEEEAWVSGWLRGAAGQPHRPTDVRFQFCTSPSAAAHSRIVV